MFSSNKLKSFQYTVLVLVCYLFYNPTDSGAVQITKSNLDMTLASNEIVFVNFYADWCRFSNMLMPIWDSAADAIAKEFPESGKVVIGKVDCDQEASVSTKFAVTKYPTLKLFRNGMTSKKEYRGQRSVEAFTEYIKEQLRDPVQTFASLSELQTLDDDKRYIIGYFDSRDQPEYEILRRVATSFKDDCVFLVGFGDASQVMHPPGTPIIVFRTDRRKSNEPDETYNGSHSDLAPLLKWVHDKCVPLVREITFENAEELTEEGLPFLILFYNPGDNASVKRFKEIVHDELIGEKSKINFLTADGKRFEHPLHHLGKSNNDLPLIAIDSFRHMYLFPKYEDIEVPGKLIQFLNDLYSGKLHREFHYGPDQSEDSNQIQTDNKPTNPPESTFKKLGPSKNRYTLLKDEL